MIFIVYRMGRLCGGAHEVSGIKAPLFPCGWVLEGGGVGGKRWGWVGLWDGGVVGSGWVGDVVGIGWGGGVLGWVGVWQRWVGVGVGGGRVVGWW